MTPLVFDCDDDTLVGALHRSTHETAAMLIVAGGLQTRAGPHRLFTDIAARLADQSISTLRFDRRGIGDSDGQLAHFEDDGADIAAALAVLRAQFEGDHAPVIGFGLCDGASALALNAGSLGLDALILLNPWAIEDGETVTPPAAALGARYARRLLNLDVWTRVLRGEYDAMGSVRRLFSRRPPARLPDRGLASRLARALDDFDGPTLIILAGGDLTAQHFGEHVRKRLRPGAQTCTIPGADHTLTREADRARALTAISDFANGL